MTVLGSMRCLACATLLTSGAALELKRTDSLQLAARELEHPWPTQRGPQSRMFGRTDVVVPHNLSGALKWSWHHPDGRYHTNIGGGATIDAGGNFYLTTNDGVRKISPEGKVLWFFEMYNKHINNEVSLYSDKVYGSTQDGGGFALDAETGKPVWLRKLAGDAGMDAGYPAATEGVFLMGAKMGKDQRSTGGNQEVFGLDAATGKTLWSFKSEWPVWNFSPLFPGDGTCVFMDFTGGMYRLGLHNGTLLWHTQAPGAAQSFSDGGASLGPNGFAYSCSNPGADTGKEGTKGVIRAFRVADGAIMWEQSLPQPCNSYPAVGQLGEGRGLSVVVTPGSFMGSPRLHGSIMAFDAATGAPQWRFNAPPWYGKMNMAKGDLEGMNERRKFNAEHLICLPAHWSSANIAGDGTVFAGRSDGRIYAVAPSPASAAVSLASSSSSTSELTADFASTPGLEVQTWDADGAPLHGAFAFAPGVMAFASCDTLYVFKV